MSTGSNNTGTRICASCGPQPSAKFCRDKTRADGLAAYCKLCARDRAAEYRARRSEGVPDHTRRQHRAEAFLCGHVLTALTDKGKLTFSELMQATEIPDEELLSDALALIGNRVASRNGTGPRTYFLNPNYQPPKSDEERLAISRQRAAEPAMSFATLRLPTTPLMKGKR
jgi:hypothetical protein